MYNPRLKRKNEPLLKIGLKQETLDYTTKNIDPSLNFLNRQLYEEEVLKNSRQKNQLSEFSKISKNLEESNPPKDNLAHRRIDFDNISGKIGQENKLLQIINYHNQPTISTDQTFQKPNIRSINYHGYNIINNNILGFCDPTQKFPKTSYQTNFHQKNISEEINNLTHQQFDDYMKFRKEQIAKMNQGGLRQNMMVKPGMGKIEGMMDERKEKALLNYGQKYREKFEGNFTEEELRRRRESEYMKDVQAMAEEQRKLNKEQVNLREKGGLIDDKGKREYEMYLQEMERNRNLSEKDKENFEKEKEKAEIEYNRMQEANQMRSQIEEDERKKKEILEMQKIAYEKEMQEMERKKAEDEYIRMQQENQMRSQMEEEEKIRQRNMAEEEYRRMQEINQRQSQMEMERKMQENMQNNNVQNNKGEQSLKFQQNEGNVSLEQRQQQINNEDYMRYMEYMRQKEYEQYMLEQQRRAEMQQMPPPQMPQMPYDPVQNPQNSQNSMLPSNNININIPPNQKNEDEYLKNVEKYEQIIRDDPEAAFKLPPPPFSYYKNKNRVQQSLDSQVQGATPGNIGKDNYITANPYSMRNYQIGKSNLTSNPITNPTNSYKFDYNRLYNPLAPDANPRINSGRLQNAGNNIISK